jgi:hypothetical protein
MSCAAPLSQDSLIAYWAHDLPPDEVERIDEHLIGCERCSAASASLAKLASALRALIPPVIDRKTASALRARGLRVVENPLLPDERRTAYFASDVDILLHRLGGLHLAHADHVAVAVRDEQSGRMILDLPQVPFDRDSTEVLVACQRHFAALPPNIVVEVTVHGREGGQSRSHFPIPHVFQH